MSLSESIILGLVQGLTEFIPVSSSAHLILAREIFGFTSLGTLDLAVDAVLQLATIFAVGLYFRKDIFSLIKTGWSIVTRQNVSAPDKNLFWAIVVGTIPAFVVGIFLESYMETVFRNGALIVWTLLLGSLIMLGAVWWSKRNANQSHLDSTLPNNEHYTMSPLRQGIAIGCFQALALIPGMSRSGMTIAGGIYLGLSQDTATRFSFLLAFPIILGSGLKKCLDIFSGSISSSGVLPSTISNTLDPSFTLYLFIASIVAFASGLAAIHFLVTYLRKGSLMPFVWYRLVLVLGLAYILFV